MMNEYINSLEENIMESTKNIDDIIKDLKKIKGNLLFARRQAVNSLLFFYIRM